MALGYIDDSIFSDIANSIRTKTGTVANYYPSDMPNAINNISGSANLGTKTIVSNGVYNASDDSLDGYNSVTVNVPIPTYNSTNLTVTTNGIYNAVTSGYDGYSEVDVQVPIPTYNSAPLSVTANGTYNASDNSLDGYNSVTVAVPMPNIMADVEFNTNGNYTPGMYDADAFGNVAVNVPIPTFNTTNITVTYNGVYNALLSGYDGYAEINVQVPAGLQVAITENASTPPSDVNALWLYPVANMPDYDTESF